MTKTIKSNARQLLFTIISKFKEKQREQKEKFDTKSAYLRAISDFLQANVQCEGVEDILSAVTKIKDMEQEALIKNQNHYLEELSSLTEISVSTLKRIKHEGSINAGVFNTPGKKRPHKPTVSNLDSFDVDAIKNKINEFYTVKKEVPILQNLLAELRTSINFLGCKETLRQILIANGYEFKKNKNERYILMERHDIAAWRHRFLREIAAKRAAGKQIVYLDETYVHKNYKTKKSWQGPSTSGTIENISSGKRHIVLHAGHENGFVPNALLVFSTKSKMADYHHDMNASNFNKWLEEKLIPNLDKPSVIVMDNASYHSIIKNKAPTAHKSKSEMKEWLTANNIHFEEYHKKAELFCLVQKYKPEPVYEADEMLKQHGHEVLRLPPYHCQLNAIELIWSLAKRKIAKRNIGLSSQDTEKLIHESFASITAEDWRKNIAHVISIENQCKDRDNITEELDEFVINVGSSSSSDSDVSMEVEILESEFDYSS